MLTHIQIQKLKPQVKVYNLTDLPGLLLRVFPSGKKVWIVNKSVKGQRIVKQLGEYPLLSLKEARHIFSALVDANRAVTPKSFEEVYLEWLSLKKSSIKNWQDIHERMAKYILPAIGKYPYSLITPTQIINLLKADLGNRGKLETIRRICGNIRQLELFAVNSGLTSAYRFQALQQVFFTSRVSLAGKPC